MTVSSKHADKIAALQRPDGGWGRFHSMARPTPADPLTTEKALRRLLALGLTKDDAPIKKALVYMRGALSGAVKLPDRREKVINWDFFEKMMLAAWIKKFCPDDAQAAEISNFWGSLIASALSSGGFSAAAYEKEYRRRVPKLNSGERLIAVSQFYMVTLLPNVLEPDTETKFFNYILNHPAGVYYVYDKPLSLSPESFCGAETVRYLAALEYMSGFSCAPKLLGFAADFINTNRGADGWDLGAGSKDGVYLPLSDSWRTPALRKADCSAFVQRVLNKIQK